jgi:hypothetical protein
MTLELVTEAKKVLLMSWSARFGMLAAILQTLAEFQDQLPVIKDFIPHGVFSLLAIACAIAVPLSRVMKQQGLIDAIAAAAQAVAPAPVDTPAVVDATNAPPPPSLVRTAPTVTVIENRLPPAPLK